MEIKQAIEVVKQAINIALGAGAFKATQDVALIHAALLALSEFDGQSAPNVQHIEQEAPSKKGK